MGGATGEGYATIYDVNAQPKLAVYNLLEDLRLAAFGAPRRHQRRLRTLLDGSRRVFSFRDR